MRVVALLVLKARPRAGKCQCPLLTSLRHLPSKMPCNPPPLSPWVPGRGPGQGPASSLLRHSLLLQGAAVEGTGRFVALADRQDRPEAGVKRRPRASSCMFNGRPSDSDAQRGQELAGAGG